MREPPEFVDRFEELFAVAYRAAYAVLGDRGDAEDCAQDVLARLLARWGRTEDHAVAWVARSATNAAIDRWRKRARTELAAHDRTHLDQTALRREDLVRALRSLPRRQRDAVVLRHLLDLSEIEAASAMGCSRGTVKSATSRGLDRLRTTLGPAWALED